MQPASKKTENAWAMYDWANSAYNLVITTTIFPAYYVGVTSSKIKGEPSYVDFFRVQDHQYRITGLCTGYSIHDRCVQFTDSVIHCRLPQK